MAVETTQEQFHVAAVEEGDLPTLAKYFAQPAVATAVEETNEYFRGRALSMDISSSEPNDPWFFTSPPHEIWQVPGNSQPRTFLFGSIIEKNQMDVLGWFYSPTRLTFLGMALAALLPATCVLAADTNQLEAVEILLTSHVFASLLTDDDRQLVLDTMLSTVAERGHFEMISVLVSHGAQVNASRPASEGAANPMESCVCSDNTSCIDVFVAHGAFMVGLDVDALRALLNPDDDTAEEDVLPAVQANG